MVLKNPGALRKMFLEPSELSLGEAYIYDDFDIEGDIADVFELADHLFSQKLRVTDKLRFGSLLMKLPSTSRPQNGRRPAELDGSPHSKDRDHNAI